jgi:hypothetical protein
MKKISAVLGCLFLFGQTASATEFLRVEQDSADPNRSVLFSINPVTGVETQIDSFPNLFGINNDLTFVDQDAGNLVIGSTANGGGFTIYNLRSGNVTSTPLASMGTSGGTMVVPALSSKITSGGVSVLSSNLNDSAAITVDTTNSTVRLSNGAIADANGANIISKQNGEIHIGENSLVTVENGGRQELFATDAAGNAINIDITRGSDLRVNGTSVMGSIRGLGEGVKATTALNAAFAAVPAFSGNSQFECGVGTGAYGDKYAIAGGCGVALSEAVSFNAGASVLPSGSESYGVGTLPEYALKAGLSINFGPSLKRKSIAALSNTSNNGFDRLALSDARNEADTAKLVAAAALERAAQSDAKADAAIERAGSLEAKAEAATQELNEMKQRELTLEAKVAALEAYKDKVDVIFAALQNNGGNLNLASYKH